MGHVADKQLRALSAAIVDALLGNHVPRRCPALAFLCCGEARHDLDPVSVIVKRRILALRRHTARDPALLVVAKRVWALYAACGYSGTDATDLFALRPAPPPASEGYGAWKPPFRPFGPIGLLLASVHQCAAAVTQDFVVLQANEPPADLLREPYQHVLRYASELPRRAAVRAAARARCELVHSPEIDEGLLRAIRPTLSSDDAGL